ncbi:MAG: putative DNA binding domain-containing protein [Acholeplasmatales bacterium]|nr:putative DNA binding domain-containing protein [Acholeplasmatales bacterium]
MQKKGKNLEYKEIVSKTYLKTVSAYANYNDGEIIFGITDDFKIVGVVNPKDACLNIENQINDSIKPRPDYMLKINTDNTISLYVRKGLNTPYRYNGKAYKRNDSSTVEIDGIEENRLVLERMNINYEELSISEDNLQFDYLGKHLKEAMDLSEFNLDTLKSLNLFNSKSGYNNAAKLLSDVNNMPGLDIVVFGDSINIFKKRITLSGKSILKQYYDALEIYQNEYVVEKIENGFRKKIELIPFDAFREVVANALVHRTWDIHANTKIEMHPDKIIISSPGGLMTDMTKEDFISGNYSSLRNPIIANVFRRMNIIEAFATGIKRVNEVYNNVIVKPIFNVTASAISVVLPVVDQVELSINEKKVFESMKKNYLYNRLEIEHLSGYPKDTLIRLLNSLIEKGLIEKSGKAKATFYIKK